MLVCQGIVSKGLRQSEAARVLRVTQPRVSDLVRGRIDLFNTDTLIDSPRRPSALHRVGGAPARNWAGPILEIPGRTPRGLRQRGGGHRAPTAKRVVLFMATNTPKTNI